MGIVADLLTLYALAIVVRAILSFFPLSYGSPLRTISDFLFRITEPVFAPIRRILPATGAFDFTPLIVLLVIEFVLVPIIRSL